MDMEEEQENWFDWFTQSEAYDKTNEALYGLSMAAFEAGWNKREEYARSTL